MEVSPPALVLALGPLGAAPTDTDADVNDERDGVADPDGVGDPGDEDDDTTDPDADIIEFCDWDIERRYRKCASRRDRVELIIAGLDPEPTLVLLLLAPEVLLACGAELTLSVVLILLLPTIDEGRGDAPVAPFTPAAIRNVGDDAVGDDPDSTSFAFTFALAWAPPAPTAVRRSCSSSIWRCNAS